MIRRVALQILKLTLAAPLAQHDTIPAGLPSRCAACTEQPPTMVQIPPGVYRPFFKSTKGTLSIAVAAFDLDAAPVTRAQYLAFVRRHPQWRRSRIKALFAEPTYLVDWHADLEPGAQGLHAPVTHVSWFAARAYCAARNARLPTVVEWERVAGESLGERDPQTPLSFAMGHAARDLDAQHLVFPGIWEWNADFNSSPGASSSSTASSLFCGDGFRATNARDYAAFLRHSLRSSLRASYALKNLGFRCARAE